MFMNRQRMQRLEMCGTILGYFAFLVVVIYTTMLLLWHAEYPVCLPDYAPSIFRLLDEPTCTYDNLNLP